jgi:hypothetical protein
MLWLLIEYIQIITEINYGRYSMRLNNYLNEQRGRSMTREQAIEFVKKKCSEAVKA